MRPDEKAKELFERYYRVTYTRDLFSARKEHAFLNVFIAAREAHNLATMSSRDMSTILFWGKVIKELENAEYKNAQNPHIPIENLFSRDKEIEINVNELMIGNLVYYSIKDSPSIDDKEIEILQGVNTLYATAYIEDNICGLSDLYPIPLCEDHILIKLGFEEQDFESEEYSTTYWAINHAGKRIVLDGKKLTYNYGGEIYLERDIEYAHQLQNLIFLHTGINLKYEL